MHVILGQKGSPYRLERSSNIIISPVDSVMKNHATQICSRYLLVLVVIWPETVATIAAPTEYGI